MILITTLLYVLNLALIKTNEKEKIHILHVIKSYVDV